MLSHVFCSFFSNFDKTSNALFLCSKEGGKKWLVLAHASI